MEPPPGNPTGSRRGTWPGSGVVRAERALGGVGVGERAHEGPGLGLDGGQLEQLVLHGRAVDGVGVRMGGDPCGVVARPGRLDELGGQVVAEHGREPVLVDGVALRLLLDRGLVRLVRCRRARVGGHAAADARDERDDQRDRGDRDREALGPDGAHEVRRSFGEGEQGLRAARLPRVPVARSGTARTETARAYRPARLVGLVGARRLMRVAAGGRFPAHAGLALLEPPARPLARLVVCHRRLPSVSAYPGNHIIPDTKGRDSPPYLPCFGMRGAVVRFLGNATASS